MFFPLDHSDILGHRIVWVESSSFSGQLVRVAVSSSEVERRLNSGSIGTGIKVESDRDHLLEDRDDQGSEINLNNAVAGSYIFE